MSQGFNVYREWLGVASSSEIPSYYELLALRPLESDTAKIEAAYQRQSAQLAPRLSGGQADVAQRLMGELAEARLTLLTPTAKRAYDTALAQAAGPAAAFGASYPGQTAQPAWPAAQPSPGWQAPPAMPAAAPGYYPAAPASAAPQPAVSETAFPAIRPRRVRRRSSPVPAVVGVLAVLVILGGTWLYFNAGETITVVDANHSQPMNGPSGARAEPMRPADKAPGEDNGSIRPEADPGSDTVNMQPPSMARAVEEAQPVTPADVDDDDVTLRKPNAGQPQMSDAAESASPDKPANDEPTAEMPPSEKSATGKAALEKPQEEPLEAKATPEEAAKVATLLKSARAALANREMNKAQEFLAEATIEATAPETTAEVGRVELLASYVEMFWDAVRQTLPKIALEELQIDGTMMAVVEADENHLIVRAEGKNHDYKWQKLPRSIAYYLANRWLAPDDPVRNLVLASFEIVDPKGDHNQAETLLAVATAAGLKSESLLEELKRARAK